MNKSTSWSASVLWPPENQVCEAAFAARCAKNNCVLEVVFLSRLETTAPNQKARTVVYGANEQSHEALVAYEKLTKKGYSDVHILEGGFAAAESILSIQKGKILPAPPSPPEGRYLIDLEESRCEWTGRNLLNKHSGTVAFSSGHLEFENGAVSGGEIVLDLTRISCSDLEGTPLHQVLIDHLQSDDFFNVEKFPNVVVAVKKFSQGNTTAEVTIKGTTHPVTIATREGLTEEGLPVAQASCSIDRTKWGVIYGSKKFFQRLAGHFVHDQIELDLRIVTER